MRSFTCIALLGVPLGDFSTSFTRLSRSLACLSRQLNSLRNLPLRGPATPEGQVPPVWALPLSLATTDGIINRVLFLGLLRCFTSPRVASADYEFIRSILVLSPGGCPIRKSAGQSLFAAHRSLSQLSTSFIASWHQGIHRLLLVA